LPAARAPSLPPPFRSMASSGNARSIHVAPCAPCRRLGTLPPSPLLLPAISRIRCPPPPRSPFFSPASLVDPPLCGPFAVGVVRVAPPPSVPPPLSRHRRPLRRSPSTRICGRDGVAIPALSAHMNGAHASSPSPLPAPRPSPRSFSALGCLCGVVRRVSSRGAFPSFVVPDGSGR
jgi:hypothetical protein